MTSTIAGPSHLSEEAALDLPEHHPRSARSLPRDLGRSSDLPRFDQLVRSGQV